MRFPRYVEAKTGSTRMYSPTEMADTDCEGCYGAGRPCSFHVAAFKKGAGGKQ